MNDEDIVITVADAHACNLCSRGIANKLKSLGYDRKNTLRVLKEGMTVREARMLNDAQINAVINKAIELRSRSTS